MNRLIYLVEKYFKYGKYYEKYVLMYGLQNTIKLLNSYDFDENYYQRSIIKRKYGSIEKAKDTIKILFEIQDDIEINDLKEVLMKYLKGSEEYKETLVHVDIEKIAKAYMLCSYDEMKSLSHRKFEDLLSCIKNDVCYDDFSFVFI